MGARRILCSRLSSTRIDARAGLLPGWTAIACQSSLRALPASVLQTASCAFVSAFAGHRAPHALISVRCDCSRIRCRCALSRNRRARSCRTEHSQWTSSKLN